MSKIFVVDQSKRPLDPVHPAQARQLLRNKKAAVYRGFPFTIIFKESYPDSAVTPLRLKLDPGAKTTGIALVNDTTGGVVFAAELKHRGFAIREALTSRRQLRRNRRARKSRYRQPRFLNRTRLKGLLAPSLQSRVENIKTWVGKLCKLAPIRAISQELVRFDMQLMRNPDIQGKEYQQGTLVGYETREFLLEKWDRQCAYCGVKDVPLQIEHIHPRAKGGSNSINNLALSCEKCNTKKGTKDIKDFLKKDPSKLEKILKQVKRPLSDAAAVNTTRFALLKVLKTTGLPVETGSGGLTKFNRSQQQLEKTHWIDAACVGKSTPSLNIKGIKPLLIAANGHGSRQSCRTDKFGFPNRHVPRKKIHFGFQTGDIVRAIVTTGKKIGNYVGKVAIRSSGSFNISAKTGLVQGISHKFCKRIHAKDGYSYGQ
ncbi:RRXRR domain-containing protein [Scytonema hofmannii FACHB-248]|uniref:RRXRR domain-containing protein n=1 Tax=Scytonema hofmannii FACHB-248 TaxID=1842502 RepID=A0ABR8GUF5_9CYAN|nr:MULTISPECIES: RNA-guided endonuclease IscB [Nostocales]MBD2606884.1 RRXRR domain-containing protein [Scytonema hofmannii FACHB-248]